VFAVLVGEAPLLSPLWVKSEAMRTTREDREPCNAATSTAEEEEEESDFLFLSLELPEDAPLLLLALLLTAVSNVAAVDKELLQALLRRRDASFAVSKPRLRREARAQRAVEASPEPTLEEAVAEVLPSSPR
jgi:hypothetical protein